MTYTIRKFSSAPGAPVHGEMIYATYYICQEIRTLNVYEAVQAGELREAPVFMDVYSDDPEIGRASCRERV